MQGRLVYKDEMKNLKAIWAAKEYGVKFEAWLYSGKSNGSGSNVSRKLITLYPSHFCNKDGLATTRTRDGRLIGSTELFSFREFYIHKDCENFILPDFLKPEVEGD